MATVSAVNFKGGEMESSSSPHKRTGVQMWQVILTGTPASGDAGRVRLADDGSNAVPQRGDPWDDDDLSLICTGVVTGQPTDQSGLQYLVRANFSTLAPADTDENEDPTEEPDQWALTWDTSSIPKYQQRDGTPVANAAGQSFDPVPLWDQDDPVVTIVRNIAKDEFDLDNPLQYNNTVNAADFQLLGHTVTTGQARIRITARPLSKNGVDYVELTFVIMLRSDGWDVQVTNEGTCCLRSGELAVPIDASGLPLNETVKLDTDGTQLAVGGVVNYLTILGYDESDYSVFNLPADIP